MLNELSLLITLIVVTFLTLVVCFSRNVARPLKISFAIAALSLAMWQLTIFVADHSRSSLVLLNNLVFVWPTVALTAFYAFLLSLARASQHKGRSARSLNSMVIVILAVLIQVVALASGHIFNDVTYDAASNSYTFSRGGSYPIYIGGFLILLAALIVRLVRSYLTSERNSTERQALKIIATTIVLTSSYGLFTNVLLPILTTSQKYIGLGVFSVDIFVAGFALSIVRYRFLDIRLIIARALAYGSSLVVLAALYATAMFIVLDLAFDVNIPASVQAVFIIVTAGAALTFDRIKKFFARLTNRLFYQDAYDAQAFFDDFNKALVSTLDLDQLLRSASDTIVSYLKADYCVVGIKESDPRDYRIVGTVQKNYPEEDISVVRRMTPRIHQVVIVADDLPEEYAGLKRLLAKNDIDILARLTQDVNTEREGLGYVALGPKKSGNPYSRQDVKVLEAATNELVVAIQNATRFEEIEQFNITLQQKIDEATRKLRRTNERLRLLDQTKDDFISMASHQLRTPLTSVKGYVSMVLDGDAGKITDTQRKLLTQAFLSSQRMVYLISDLLNVSRLKTGKFIIEPVESRLDKVIEEELEQLTETIKSRGLKLQYHKPEHFPVLMLDETKIRQVIMNFVDNATYYTPSGGSIDVYLEDKGKSVEFRVVDTGIGVPRHEQHHLFTKFYRAKNAKNARPDGTGLGIFMAKKVIIAQGGAVIFRSTEGKGSTFGFTFPKAKLLPPLKPESKQPASKEAQPA